MEQSRLLVPERFDGVQVGSFPGRIHTEDDTDERAESEPDERPVDRKDSWELERNGGEIATKDPKTNSHNPAHLA